MKLKTKVFRSINRVLETVGFEFSPITYDFSSRITGKSFDYMIGRVSAAVIKWIDEQDLFEKRGELSEQDARSFFDTYLKSPFLRVGGGSRFNNLFSLFAIAKVYQPELIIDSGTFTGASAWALSLGAPKARTLSYDIDLTRLRLRVPKVEYFEHDWMTDPVDATKYDRTLAYFDDHLDQARRLLETHKRGIKLAIFDDDFSRVNFANFANGGVALPKVEFILDKSLRDMKELTWIEHGKQMSWPVDVSYLDRAAATIAAATRLPDVCDLTGIEQLPYRIVKMAN